MTDSAIEEMLSAHPLVSFSVYTFKQTTVLASTATEFRYCLDKACREEGGIEGVSMYRAYGLFWLWVLGAYEVTRTMCSASNCFEPKTLTRLKSLSRELRRIRIPFAKQEFAERDPLKARPIGADASIAGWDRENRDIYFDLAGTRVSSVDLIAKFEKTLLEIKREDILRNHRDAYTQRKNGTP